jgi:hypothetical protein
VVGAANLVALTACGPAGLIFYDVERTRTEQCTIRSNGEFCVEPEQFGPPVFEAWAVEFADDVDRLHIGTETWPLDPLVDGADPATTPRTATRQQIVSTGDGGCVTTTNRSVEFFANDQVLQGTFRATTRIDGPPACGATPVGDRFVDTLSGQVGTP